MQKSLELPRLNDDLSLNGKPIDFVCNECGGTFQKPILATISSSGQVQTYYACPRCLTRMRKQRKEISILKKDDNNPSVNLEDDVKCEHFLGYLKKRPKNLPIPDECMTCNRLIECMSS